MTKCVGSEQERRLAICLYGFPPGVGATGTAALLNVPRSLEALLKGLAEQGYDLGPAGDAGSIDGEAIIEALKMQEEGRAISEGAKGIERRYDHVIKCMKAPQRRGGMLV